MNHQPFEAWLLEDKVLNSAEKRDLNAHLRECKSCAALAETGLALRSARVVSPAPGFAMRFQNRLAVQKVTERRRRLWGLLALLFSGAGLFAWSIAPFVLTFASNPIEWLITAASYFLFLFSSLQAFGEFLSVLARMLPAFLPPYAWMVVLSALLGMGLLWVVSIWRFARNPQGVTA